MLRLGVNIDHVATVRQARRGVEPDPVAAAVLAELGGADAITVHLREDRRHIQDRDVRLLKQTVQIDLNLELSIAPSVLEVAYEIVPDQATIVPERRQEVTTEGGLDLTAATDSLQAAINRLRQQGTEVSLFLDPDAAQIERAQAIGAQAVELHTGAYATARSGDGRQLQLKRLEQAAELIQRLGMRLVAGHGLNYHNVFPVASISGMTELNIGHSIVSRSLAVGMQQAVRQMRLAMAGR
jgi:pyridoxine 5-phosphate synthase